MNNLFNLALLSFFCLCGSYAHSQQRITLQVLSLKDTLPVINATVIVRGKQGVQTNSQGIVYLTTHIGQSIRIEHVAYQSKEYLLSKQINQTVYLLPIEGDIEEIEVINTGYFSAPKERLSGSFTHIDNKLLNRSPSPNLLDRLEGISNGLQFDRGGLSGEDTEGSPLLRVRGASTIISDARPLIIVDNFPYEEDIRTINPNDVESVTILKDASAASIWGARAGNGVIVINMKKGGFQQKPTISFQSNLRFSPRPDLFHNQNVVNPNTIMEFQKALFEKNGYIENNYSFIPFYVELLIKKRDGLISTDEFDHTQQLYAESDIRKDAMQYIYRPSKLQDYNLQVRGGGDRYSYQLSAAYADEATKVNGQGNKQIQLDVQQNLELAKGLNLEAYARYYENSNHSNGIFLSEISNDNLYLPLRNEVGVSQPIMLKSQGGRMAVQEQAVEQGLLDWMYRPVDELYLNNIDARNKSLMVGTNLSFRLPWGWSIRSSYNYRQGIKESERYNEAESYSSRNLINRFTQDDGSYYIPKGGILTKEPNHISRSHSIRLQTEMQKNIWNELEISVLAGLEGSSEKSESGFPFTFFGYDPVIKTGTPQHFINRTPVKTRPRGLQEVVPVPYSIPQQNWNRNLSAYGNMGLLYRDKYIFNGSLRWDGSNLIGVKTNARGVALWSLGAAWNIHREGFFDTSIVSELKLRGTYGSAGNINKSQGHLPVIRRDYGLETARPYSSLVSPGNPNLRWEQVNTWNVGMDWAIERGNLSGSFEYYNKHAIDLLSSVMIDPTIGVSEGFMQNYANLRTQGFDFSLQHILNLGKFRVQSNLLLNYSFNRVSRVSMPAFTFIDNYFSTRYYEKDKSVDLLYALPTYGLNSMDGSLKLYDDDGNIVTDYSAFTNQLVVEDLVVAGLRVAPYYASYRLGVSYKNLQVSTLLIAKFGHVMRRNSMVPGIEWNRSGAESFHMDYYNRWKNPGDELHTTVPAGIDKVNLPYSNLYKYSDALITPLDYIGIRDVNFSYSLPQSWRNGIGLKQMEIYCSINQLGVIWKKNNVNINPEYPNTTYPALRQYYMGVRIQF